ncbi:hypothetical protein TSAR_015494, partial [Trichomalopsis sarcophagae]
FIKLHPGISFIGPEKWKLQNRISSRHTNYRYPTPPKRTGKQKNNADESQRPHRLSLEERKDSFILHVQTAYDVLPRLNEFKNRLLTSKQT